MTLHRHPRPAPPARPRRAATGRLRRRLTLAVAAAALAVGPGCRLFNKSSDSGGGGIGGGVAGKSDPLFTGGRIPPQNVPLPDRGAKGRGDPLLGSPTNRSTDRGSAKASEDDRWRGTYLPDKSSTNAALAARLRDDNSDLRIGDATARGRDDRATATPTGASSGVVPASVRGERGVPDAVVAELKRYGVSGGGWDTERTSNGEWVFRARVPIGNGADRQYEGVGPTPEAAARQVLELVKADRQ